MRRRDACQTAIKRRTPASLASQDSNIIVLLLYIYMHLRVAVLIALSVAAAQDVSSSSNSSECAHEGGVLRPRAVLLAYTWGAGPSSCSPYFMRSWVALPPNQRARTDLRILWEGKDLPCAGELAGGGARYIKMPSDVLSMLRATKLNPAAYRMRAFTWWLQQPEAVEAAYGYVGVLGTRTRSSNRRQLDVPCSRVVRPPALAVLLSMHASMLRSD